MLSIGRQIGVTAVAGAAILFPALFVAHGVGVAWFAGLLERRSQSGSDASK